MTTFQDKEKNDPFSPFSSKIRRIYIPLPGFQYFHRPSEVNDVDPHFIGRERISQILENWLSDKNQNTTGVYLITGYRGMGKTSFVGKVINELINKNKITFFKKRKILLQIAIFIPTVLLFVLYLIFLYNNQSSSPSINAIPTLYTKAFVFLFIAVATTTIIILASSIRSKKNDLLYFAIIGRITLFPLLIAYLYAVQPFWVHKQVITLLLSLATLLTLCIICSFQNPFSLPRNKKPTSRYILKIKVNIGNEVSSTKDILALFSHTIRKRISDYISQKSHLFPIVTISRALQWTLVAFLAILFFEHTIPIIEPAATNFYNVPEKGFFLRLLEFINNSLYQFRIQHNTVARLIGMSISCMTAYGLIKVIRIIWNQLNDYFSGKKTLKPSIILHRLNNLCERIDSILQNETSPARKVNMSILNMSFSRRTRKKYYPASIREIEQSLIDIIHDINESHYLNCRLVIILDELDKLCKRTTESTENENVYPEFTVDENGVSDDLSSNEKKHRILGILGQLKFFFSTAQAKFVFIAGHELYDAYLADVSDREFSVSSIFNGVINVDSFFTCDQRTKDITRLTECFLCKYLISNGEKTSKRNIDQLKKTKETDTYQSPDYTTNKSITEDKCHEIDVYNLEEYAKSILDTIPNNNENGCDPWRRREIEAVLVFLRQFITYLTFISNGAPKKLISTLEKYIISKETYKEKQKTTGSGITLPLIATKEPANANDQCDYYLAFGYHDQQKIGFIHYIAHPIFENIISPSSEFGDKLLVASSFLIAHIYKYHNSGFSKGDLEYMPELLDSNRSPELRPFIDSFIGYLGQIHLTPITSGIYSYKFPMRLSEEISMFSKKSEELSAIFNFSLDDSLAVKKFYYRIFDFYQQKQKSPDLIKGSFQHNLGEIHLSNNEYTQAISQFRQAVQSLESLLQQNIGKSSEYLYSGTTVSHIMRYTRIMLKLGLAYEKRSSLDSAYMTYNTLTSRLVAFRDIDESLLGLKHIHILSQKDEAEYLYPDRKGILLVKNDLKKDPHSQHLCYNRTKIDDKKNIDYWIYGEELTDNLCDQMSPQKHALISKLSAFEDLRLAYLPILAKLSVLEKHNICGITKDNVKIANAEFRYLYLLTNSSDKYLLRVDFYRKLGDILYYKNGSLFKTSSNNTFSMINDWGYDLKSAIFDYCYRTGLDKGDFETIIQAFKKLEGYVELNNIANKIKLTGNYSYLRRHIKNIIQEFPRRIKDQWTLMEECIKQKSIKESPCPCAACNHYARSLSILLYKLTGENITENVAYQFLSAIEENTLLTKRHNELTQTALSLSSMGNILLSCSSPKNKIHGIFLDNISQFPGNWKKIKKNLKPTNHLESAILHYWTAMQYHNMAGNHREAMQCLTWIFNILSGYLAKNRSFEHFQHGPSTFIANIQKKLMEVIIKIHSIRNYAGLKEISKMKNILNPSENINQDTIFLHNLGLSSVMPDIEELLISYYELLLSLIQGEKYTHTLSLLFHSPFLTYMRNESLTYNRVISLLFKAKLNERILWLIKEKESSQLPNGKYTKKINSRIGKNNLNIFTGKNYQSTNPVNIFINSNGNQNPDIEDTRRLLFFLISDSIFCLTSITDFIHTTSRTSLFTDSFCFSVYKRLYQWVSWKEWVIKKSVFNNKEELENKINSLVEKHQLHILKKTYLMGMINKYYNHARSMHNEGIEYHDFIKDMYLLDDDLQNNTCQFYFALERYKIRIKRDNPMKIENTGYFSPQSYFEYRQLKKSSQ